jgi:hypothetical protein
MRLAGRCHRALPLCVMPLGVVLCVAPLLVGPHRRADRTRTCNLRFWRPLLYQLSHHPKKIEIPRASRFVHIRGKSPDSGTEKLGRFQLPQRVYGIRSVGAAFGPSGRALARSAGLSRHHCDTRKAAFPGCFAPQRRAVGAQSRASSTRLRFLRRSSFKMVPWPTNFPDCPSASAQSLNPRPSRSTPRRKS